MQMRLKVYKSLWGMEGSLEAQVEKIVAAGYDGIETPLFFVPDAARFRRLLDDYALDFVAQIFTAAPHEAAFREELERAAALGPRLINAQSGKDAMTWDEKRRFFESALRSEADVGVPVGHETHRGRAMFTPWHTAELLTAYPELRITSDISHWLCVCESWLEEHGDALRLAASRTVHVHARVGYPEGPQVPHPADPAYAKELAVHRGYWLLVQSAFRAEGRDVLTMTPEYGPPGYLHTLPFTGEPAADLWDVCLWAADWCRDTFGEKGDGA